MGEMKHTAGEWKVWDDGEVTVILAPDRSWLAQLTYLTAGGRRDVDEVKANARLIAAAPDMLEALKRVTSAHDEWVAQMPAGVEFDDPLSDAIKIAEAAIAKATREEGNGNE